MKDKIKIEIPFPTTEQRVIWEKFVKAFDLVETGDQTNGGGGKVLYFDPREKKPETGWSYRSQEKKAKKAPKKAKPQAREKMSVEEFRRLSNKKP